METDSEVCFCVTGEICWFCHLSVTYFRVFSSDAAILAYINPCRSLYLLFFKKLPSVYQKLYISPLSPLFLNSFFKLSFCMSHLVLQGISESLSFTFLQLIFILPFFIFFCLKYLNISSYFLQQPLHHLHHQCIFTHSD